MQLIQSDPDIIETRSITLTVKLMANLISEYSKEKSIALPALAVLSLVKAKNSAQTLNAMLSIGPSSLSKILEIAAEIEPELEGSILRYIESVEEQPDKKKLRSASASNAKGKGGLQTGKYSLEELLADTTKSNECIEYLVEKIKDNPKDHALVGMLEQPLMSGFKITEKSMMHLL